MRQCIGILLCLFAITLLPTVSFGQACTVQWTAGTAPYQELIRGQAAYWEGKVYVTNGRFSEKTKFTYLDDLWIYDIADDSWTLGPSYDTFGWMNACMVVDEGKLFLFGGYDGSDVLDNTKIYDIATSTWSDGATMPHTASGAQCAVIDGKAYVAGGGTETAHAAYNIAEDTWNSAVVDLASEFGYGRGTTDGTLFYIYGNYMDNTTLAYDPGTDSWSALDTLDTMRSEPAGGYAAGSLYAFSGGPVGVAVNSSVVLDLPSGSWTAFTPTIPTPVTASASTYVDDFGGMFVVVNGGSNGTEYTKTQILTLCLAGLDSITPDTGDNDIDVNITITGVGFESTDTAYLTNAKGQITLTGLTVENDTTITATVPASSPAGIYDLVVESISGETDTLDDAFEVIEAGMGDDDDDDDNDTGDDDDTADDDDAVDDDTTDDDAVDDDDTEDDDSTSDDDDDDDDGGCCG